jgi:FkbM family methyltransferase
VRTLRNAAVIVLAAIGALAAAAGTAGWLWGSTQSGLARIHSLLTDLQRTVVTLDIGEMEIPLFVNPEDKVITRLLLERGVWEPNETHWITKSLAQGDVFVDLGANIGYYTVLAARLVGESGHVYAFEPDPIAFSLLERNVRLSGLRNVTLEQKAVSDAPGTIRLFIAEKNKGDHRIFQAAGGTRESIGVEAVSLDDYFAGRETEINFIKIDTQGAEGAIIAGAEKLLSMNDHVRLAMEFAPWNLRQFGVEAADLLETLEALDFRFFEIGSGRHPVGLLEPVASWALLRRYPGKTEFPFTNLFLIKGRSELGRLRSEVAARGRALDAEDQKHEVACAKWLAGQRAEVAGTAWVPLAQAAAGEDATTDEPGPLRMWNSGTREGVRIRFDTPVDPIHGLRLDVLPDVDAPEEARFQLDILTLTLLVADRDPSPVNVSEVALDDGSRIRGRKPLHLNGSVRMGGSFALRLAAPLTPGAGGSLELHLRDRARTRPGIEAFASAVPNPWPRGLEVALAREPQEWTPDQRRALRREYRRFAPALASFREDLRAAEAELERFQTLAIQLRAGRTSVR